MHLQTLPNYDLIKEWEATFPEQIERLRAVKTTTNLVDSISDSGHMVNECLRRITILNDGRASRNDRKKYLPELSRFLNAWTKLKARAILYALEIRAAGLKIYLPHLKK